jgi:hypothetical protein
MRKEECGPPYGALLRSCPDSIGIGIGNGIGIGPGTDSETGTGTGASLYWKGQVLL